MGSDPGDIGSLDHVLSIGQVEVLGGGCGTEEVRSRHASDHATHGSGDMVVPGGDVRHQGSEKV